MKHFIFSAFEPLQAPSGAFEDFDDCRVPSTPTLMPPRRGDGFAEAISSPAQLNQRFVFGMGGEQMIPGLGQLDSQAGNAYFSLFTLLLVNILT